MANGMINAGMSCQLIHYVHEEHDKFFEVCKNFDFIIVRCNPGQIKADGGDQNKFDDGMRAIRKLGIQVWPSPDVMEKMGAKDALCKVATMNIGLEDTLAYYTPEEFAAGFKKTMAFQPRVIKQNRGSSGEGIWVCNGLHIDHINVYIKMTRIRFISFCHVVNHHFLYLLSPHRVHHSKNIKESGLSSSRKAITALLMARDPARMVRSSCSWRPTTTTRKNTPWLSLSNSA